MGTGDHSVDDPLRIPWDVDGDAVALFLDTRGVWGTLPHTGVSFFDRPDVAEFRQETAFDFEPYRFRVD